MVTKTQKQVIQSQINFLQKDLGKVLRVEERARINWAKGNSQNIKDQEDILSLTRFGTKKHNKLRERVLRWKKQGPEFTEIRDAARQEAAKIKEKIAELKSKMTQLLEKELAEITAADKVVEQVLALKAAELLAIKATNTYLTNQVFPHLIDQTTGRVRSQVSFVSKDGQFRVVAMVNTITHVDSLAAEEAKSLIDEFFGNKMADMDDVTKAWYDLTQQILVEKTRFKVGPKLYQFLSLEIDSKLFPELRKAQALLRGGLRSEKSNSYIKIYEKKLGQTKWKVWHLLAA